MITIDANTVTVLIALSAIISPILVALINNRHQAKMKKLELEHLSEIKRIEAKEAKEQSTNKYLHSLFDNYLQSTGRCIANPTHENIKLYGENYSISFAYFPAECHDQLKAINDSIRKRNWDTANMQLEGLSIQLSPLMKDMLKE